MLHFVGVGWRSGLVWFALIARQQMRRVQAYRADTVNRSSGEGSISRNMERMVCARAGSGLENRHKSGSHLTDLIVVLARNEVSRLSASGRSIIGSGVKTWNL